MPDKQLEEAIGLLQDGNLKTGQQWEEAHEICQAHEGQQSYDWLHAIIHRIEGDDRNAGYWYNRAGKERHDGSVEEELRMIQTDSSG